MNKKNYMHIAVVASLILLCGCQKQVENKEITISCDNQQITGNYTGAIDGKSPIGTGTFTSIADDGKQWVYTGGFENNSIKGNGQFTDYPYSISIGNDSFAMQYTGESSDGIPNGNGKVAAGDFTYEGSFDNGKATGIGNATAYPFVISYDGIAIEGKYSGEMLDGTPSGKGSFESTNSDTAFSYQGDWESGNLKGNGTLNCNFYTVHFIDKNRTGTYSGNVLDGVPTGQGKFDASTDDNIDYEYSGEWKDGIMNGNGSWIYDGGDYWNMEGNFVNGEFIPTPSEFIKYCTNSPTLNFSVSDETLKYIDENVQYFGEQAVTEYPDGFVQPFLYDEYRKSSYKYQTVFVKTDASKLHNVSESNIATTVSNEITELYGEIPGYSFEIYGVFYLGTLPDIYSGDKVKITGIPIAIGSVENKIGGQTDCTIILASKVEKVN